ncbi:MAG: threonine/serine exporter family protein [Candidatus Cloacimonas sp.]
MPKVSPQQVLDLSLEVGRIILQSGGNTNRVELMMKKTCNCFGYPNTESYVTPTGIFISIKDEAGNIFTSIKRIDNRRIDLGKITRISRMVNCLQQKPDSDPDYQKQLSDFAAELKKIDTENPWPSWLKDICGGGTSGFFCLLFGGSWAEFAVAFFIGVLVTFGLKYLEKLAFNNFLLNAIAAALIVLLAKTLDIFVPSIRLDNIIIGGIMLLVPGLSITNAIRDTMSGDLVAGTARAVEALFITVGIVAGSATMLKIWSLWGY